MNQYFIEGEEVVVVSDSNPNHNGDYVIKMGFVMPRNKAVPDSRHGPVTWSNKNVIAGNVHYFLFDHVNDNGFDWPVRQSSLRKKHPKGESFDTLMEKLNEEVTV